MAQMTTAVVENKLKILFTKGTASLIEFRNNLIRRSDVCKSIHAMVNSKNAKFEIYSVWITEIIETIRNKDIQENLNNHPGLIKLVVAEFELWNAVNSDLLQVISSHEEIKKKQDIILEAENVVKTAAPASEEIRSLVKNAEKAGEEIRIMKKRLDYFKALIKSGLMLIKDLHTLEFTLAPDPNNRTAIEKLLASSPEELKQKASSVLKGLKIAGCRSFISS